MTVKELITKLSKLPNDLEIFLVRHYDEDFEWRDELTEVTLKSIHQHTEWCKVHGCSVVGENHTIVEVC